MSITLCMIVKNEADRLPACLTAARDCVDEMIVLDTGSTDDTTTIARDLGAEVYNYTWTNDFSAARNVSLGYGTGDWILVLDADEIMVPAEMAAIAPYLTQPDLLVVNFLRQEIGAEQSPYSLVSRLFRRHPSVFFTRPYHSLIDDSVIELRQTEPHWRILDWPKVAMLHDGYHPDSIAALGKFDRAAIAMERFLADHPDDAYDCAKLGALYVEQEDFDRGISLLRRGLTSTESQVRYEVFFHLGIAYGSQGDDEAAVEFYQQAIAEPILDILKLGAYNNLGSLLLGHGLTDAAEDLFTQCIAIDSTFARGHYNLGLARREQGNLTGAVAAYEVAIGLDPTPQTYQNLGVALFKLGRQGESLRAFEQAILAYGADPMAQQLRQQLMDLGLG
jgi:glycosyltransferase involved in cell wall biosynthesis